MNFSYRPSRLMLFNFLSTLASIFVVFIWAYSIDLDLNIPELLETRLVFPALLLMIALFCVLCFQNDRLVEVFVSWALMLVFMAVSVVLCHLGATLRMPMVDHALASIDQSVRFDWPAMVQWFVERPELSRLARIFYNQVTNLGLLAVAIILVVTRRCDMLEEMFAFTIITLLLSILIGSLFPAVTAYAHFGIPQSVSTAIGVEFDSDYAVGYESVRNGASNFIDWAKPRGMLAFPSFHAILALMLPLFLRHNRWLFILALPCCILIIISTPLIGGHYFVDVFGGVIIAWFGHRMVLAIAGQQHASAPILRLREA